MSLPITSLLRRSRWPLLVVAGTAGILFFLNLTSDEPQKSQRAKNLWQVETQTVMFQDEMLEARLYGRIETPALVTLTSPVTGYVLEAPALPGQHMNHGDLLVRIDPRDQQLIVAQRKADLTDSQARLNSEQLRSAADQQALEQEQLLLASARREYQRQISLNKNNLVAERLVDDAQSNLARQQLSVISRQQSVHDAEFRQQQLQAQLSRSDALYQQALLDLERSEIIADFSGRVANVSVAAGERVRAGDPLAEFYSVNDVEVKAQIPERYLDVVRRQLASEQPVMARLEQSDSVVTLKLDRLAAAIADGRGGVDGYFRASTGEQVVMALGRPVIITLQLPVLEPVVRIEPRSLYDDSYVYRLSEENALEAIEASRLGSALSSGEEKVLIHAQELKAGDRLLITRIANAVTGLVVAPAIDEQVVSSNQAFINEQAGQSREE